MGFWKQVPRLKRGENLLFHNLKMGSTKLKTLSEKMMIEEIKKIFPDFNPSSLSSEELTNMYKIFIEANQREDLK